MMIVQRLFSVAGKTDGDVYQSLYVVIERLSSFSFPEQRI